MVENYVHRKIRSCTFRVRVGESSRCGFEKKYCQPSEAMSDLPCSHQKSEFWAIFFLEGLINVVARIDPQPPIVLQEKRVSGNHTLGQQRVVEGVRLPASYVPLF